LYHDKPNKGHTMPTYDKEQNVYIVKFTHRDSKETTAVVGVLNLASFMTNVIMNGGIVSRFDIYK